MSKNKPNFEEFAYSGPEDTSVIDQIVESREKTYSATGFGHDIDQRVATYVSTPPTLEGDEFIVRSTAFSDDNGRESGAYFDALIAEATGRRVIAVNPPGIEYGKFKKLRNSNDFSKQEASRAQELTPDQVEDLKNGSFKRSGEATMIAMHNTAQLYVDDPAFIITASSMGVALTAGALRTARDRNIEIAGVTLAEPVNVSGRNIVTFGQQFGAANGTAPGYVKGNPEILNQHDNEGIPGWLKRVGNDWYPNWRYATALARGGFVADLGKLDHLEGKPVRLTRGGGSELSPEADFHRLENRLAYSGLRLSSEIYGDPVDNPHDHPYTMTVRSVIDAAQDVIERQ